MEQTASIAKNHICISRALFNEGMRAAESGEYKKSIKKVTFVLAFLFTAAAVWLLCTGGSLIFLLGEAIFLGALLFWLMFMLPNARRKAKYKAMTCGTGDIPERTTTFYQNHLTVLANNNKETVIQYSDIINWQETKNLYLMNCHNKISILLDKKGFIAGDFDIVKKLLK